MKAITNYRETQKNEMLPSVKDNISNSAISKKQSVLNYLKKGKKVAVALSSAYDYVADDYSELTLIAYSDDVYTWTSEEIYMFEHYNLRLNSEFIEYITKLV